MLTRSRETLSLALALSLLASAPAVAGDLTTKLDRAKRADHHGYAPLMLQRAATVGEDEPNDTVEDAQALAVGDQVDASVPSGDVDWFLVDATGDAYVTISTASRDGSLTDTVLDVFSADGQTPIASDDDSGLGLFSALESLEGGAVLAVRVTRFSSLGDDDYAIVAESASAPPAAPANDTPATAEVLADCNAAASGTTVGAGSALATAQCVTPDPLGGEVFYRFELPYSYQLVIHVDPDETFDPSLVLFTDPASPDASCLEGVDEAFAGERETLLYTNEDDSAESLTVYLAIDSWDPQRAGGFTATVTCDFVVSDETSSFGALKARF